MESGSMEHFACLLIRFHRQPMDYAQYFGTNLRKVIQALTISWCFRWQVSGATCGIQRSELMTES